MNALQLTAICFGLLGALSAVLCAAAWLYHRWAHRDHSIEGDLARLLQINAVQIVLVCLFGAAIGLVFYLGWRADCP